MQNVRTGQGIANVEGDPACPLHVRHRASHRHRLAGTAMLPANTISQGTQSMIHPEIKSEKPQFLYNLYPECVFLHLISGCKRPCYACIGHRIGGGDTANSNTRHRIPGTICTDNARTGDSIAARDAHPVAAHE
eukprot:2221460-Rhodomonas_salina.1